MIRGPRGYLQGYNAQAACTETQVIIAAELSTDSPDARLLEPMIGVARGELAAVGLEQAPQTVLADGGYWNVPHIEALVADGSQVIVNPDASARASRPAHERRLRSRWWGRVVGPTKAARRAVRRGETTTEPVPPQDA